MSSIQEERKWQPFMGNCYLWSEYIAVKRTYSPWILLKFIDAFLRGFGQVILSNNPISGFLFLLALIIVEPIKASVAVICAVIGIVWAFINGFSRDDISFGITTFNPILLGSFAHYAMPTIFSNLNFLVWFSLVLGVMLCVYLNAALMGFLSKWKLPLLTLPFIFVEYLLVLSVFGSSEMSNLAGFENVTLSLEVMNEALDLENISSNTSSGVSYGQVFTGTMYSFGTLIGIENAFFACISCLAMAIYSPIMCAFGIFGAFLSTITAIFVIDAPLEECYRGIWGYNGLLTGAALGGFLFILTWRTFVATIFAIIFATFLQHLLNFVFANSILLQYNIAFNISAMTFLCISLILDDSFPRPDIITFPEKHRYDYLLRQKRDQEEFLVKRVSVVKFGTATVDEERALPSSND